MKARSFQLNTIRRRFALIVSVLVIGCLLLIQLTFFSIQHRTLQEHCRSTMEVAVESIGLMVEKDYDSLVQLSQIMDATGVIGQEFYRYLDATAYTQKYQAQMAVNELLVTVTFFSDTSLAVYYDTAAQYDYFSQPIVKHFSPEALPELKQTGAVCFHTVHASQSRLHNADVVSITRRAAFFASDRIVIYAEQPINIATSLDDYFSSYGYRFTYLQLDDSGMVLYASDERMEAGTHLQEIIESAETFGNWKDYFWSARMGKYGGYDVLLVPKRDIHSDSSIRMYYFILPMLFGAMIVAVTVLLLEQLVIKKNQILQQEIQRVGEGNLSKVTQHTGLQDYDQLLNRFDWMIEQLQQQMLAIEAAERRNSEIERTILYYQINPHFLLNSLNSLYWQARMNLPGGIDQHIAQLTGILRYSLGKDNTVATLRKEVEMLQKYLLLQEKRYNFTYTLDVQEGAYLSMKTPRLFIQPIVENSIEHGMDEGDHLSVRIYCDGAWACICVQDNGIGIHETQLQKIRSDLARHNISAGIGLRYVQTVISAMFEDRAQIKIESHAGSGTTVQLRLPIDPEVSSTETEKGEKYDKCTDRG